MGYKTCHILKNSLDASICAKDCERLENQKFAKNCKKAGGLFKCCIRRDAAFCHECRYHQTLKSTFVKTTQVLLHAFDVYISHPSLSSGVF